MDPKIVEALSFVYAYANHVDDWIVIKKELLKAMAPEERKLFSTRDPVTKAQRTNDFEYELAHRWSVMTGRLVIFNK